MPIGPIGKSPVEGTQSLSTTANPSADPAKKAAFEAPAKSMPEAAAPTAGNIATQLVRDARTARASGKEASLSTPLGNLVNALVSQMGVDNLPQEHRQKLVAQLENDPVVRNLIG